MKWRVAFSLIELSIVLVILGLLVGGILAGQSLIRASELRSVSADLQRYAAASYVFRDRYMAFPGDLTNATSFWTSGTANGDGNQLIEGNERFRFWQHLSLAGLVEANYSGATGTYRGGINIPRSKIQNLVYSARFVSDYNSTGVTGNGFIAGGERPPSYGTPYEGVLLVTDLYNLDKKLDDGVASSGKLIGQPGFSYQATPGQYCTTPDLVGRNFDYLLTDTVTSCHIGYYGF